MGMPNTRRDSTLRWLFVAAIGAVLAILWFIRTHGAEYRVSMPWLEPVLLLACVLLGALGVAALGISNARRAKASSDDRT